MKLLFIIALTLSFCANVSADEKVKAFVSGPYLSVLYDSKCDLKIAEAPVLHKAISINPPFRSYGCWGNTVDGMIKVINIWESPDDMKKQLGNLYHPEINIEIMYPQQLKPATITKDGFAFD